ncbi:hypothetical protein [Streptomyces vilmorinianum]|uniref:hypothetical protein n=1 Tax=Streptomyces vilmorinianum TaxID=3051092 RepID=UPI0010FB93B1|nr:hypothetical protein [Streptomyces vilmorinianum]
MRPRREDLPGPVALRADGPLEPPPLRTEMTDSRRMRLRQGDRPVLLARVDEDRGGVRLHHRAGYRSPLPPIRADESRRGPDRPRRYAGWLEAADEGALHAGRWVLSRREMFPPYVWRGDFLTAWPDGQLDRNDSWNGVTPTATTARRPRSPRGRTRARPCRPARRTGSRRQRRPPRSTAYFEGMPERGFAGPDPERQRADVAERYGWTVVDLPYDEARTFAWPIPGGADEWDRWMLEFRHEHDRDE